MNIVYNQNPLLTTIELDEKEWEILRLKVKYELLEEQIFLAHYYLDEKRLNMKEAREAVDPEWYMGDKAKIDEHAEKITAYYVTALRETHGGDCTCFPASCDKCHAEQLLGIDTIKGLGKHSAHKIIGAFADGRSIDEAISILQEYHPTRSGSWLGLSVESFTQHVPRWKAEANAAADWLEQYKKDHFSEV